MASTVARDSSFGRVSRNAALWAGRVISAVPILMMVLSAAMKLTRAPQLVDEFVGALGYRESALTGLALLELGCVALYAIPRTAVLGAVLLTGYLGGAIATHVRVGQAFVVPLLLGVLVWVGIYLGGHPKPAINRHLKTGN